jgi:hypothetical protein
MPQWLIPNNHPHEPGSEAQNNRMSHGNSRMTEVLFVFCAAVFVFQKITNFASGDDRMSPSRKVSAVTAFVTKHAAWVLALAAVPQGKLRHLASRLLPALLVFLGLGTALSVRGQSVQFMGAQRSLYATGSGVSAPYGVAVDKLGDVWITVAGGACRRSRPLTE